MDWQQMAALGVVALTVGVFVWRRLRPRRFDFRRDTGCGCASAGTPPGLVIQGRRGESPRVTIKTG